MPPRSTMATTQRRCIESSSHGLPETEDRERIVDALSQILGVADAPLTEGESSWSVRRFLEGLAAQGPIVLIVEDIHWAEPTLLDLLETIADWLRDTPLLVVCTARVEIFERRPGWGGGRPDAAVLAVRPLSRADTDLLIQNLVRHPGLDADAKERIAMAAEGNPLFVEQLLSMWIDEGYLRQEGGAWSLAADLTRAPLPTSVQMLLTARLDRLPAPNDRFWGSHRSSAVPSMRPRSRSSPMAVSERTSYRASASWSART